MFTPSYRTDIDCLRAVAVFIVIGFHWQINLLSGGFVGVDVFFVVSGYLITKMISESVFAGSFSFFEFYVRRARRLLPALYVVIIFCAIVGWFVLLPPAMLNFWRSALSIVLLSSNILFWRETGYFDKPTLEKPLLHTWSLAVEEQFYLFVPACLWILIWAFGNRRWLIVLVLAALAAVSFAFCCWQTAHAPSAAFYLLPARAWEFFIGSSLVVLEKRTAPTAQSFVALGLGTAMIAIAAFGFGPTTPFPGPAALLPCVGTALVIWAKWQPISAPLRAALAGGAFLGRISYSLYLWHWPVYVFCLARTGSADALTDGTKGALFVAVLLLSVLSYFLIEKPFRTRRVLVSGRAFVAASILVAGAFTGLAITAESTPILSGRLAAEAARLIGYANYPYRSLYREGDCFLTPEQDFAGYDQSTCFDVASGRQNVLLWGDSMAAHFLPGLIALAARDGFNVLQANGSFCPPIFDFDVKDRPNCRSFNDGVGRLIFAHPNVLILLSADWTTYVEGFGIDKVTQSLRSTVTRLNDRGIRTIVLGPSIRWRQHLSGVLARRAEQNLDLNDTDSLILQSQFALDERLKAELPGVWYVSILDTICPSRKCPAFAHHAPITWDTNHLTKEGSTLIMGAIGQRLEERLSQ